MSQLRLPLDRDHWLDAFEHDLRARRREDAILLADASRPPASETRGVEVLDLDDWEPKR